MAFVLIVPGFGLLVEFGQIGVLFAPEKAKPSGTKLNVVSNVKNIFSMKNLMEVAEVDRKDHLLLPADVAAAAHRPRGRWCMPCTAAWKASWP